MDLFSYLSRDDKWYLGSGGPLLWAPRFPAWVDVPGFWDQAHYYSQPLGPLFTVTLLDDGGQPLVPVARRRRWVPGLLQVEYHLPSGLLLREDMVVAPGGVAASVFTFSGHHTERGLHLVAWTSQEVEVRPARRVGDLMRRDRAGVCWTCGTAAEGVPHCFLTTFPPPGWARVVATESAPVLPQWDVCPFGAGAPTADREDALLQGKAVLHGAVGFEIKEPTAQRVTVAVSVGDSWADCVQAIEEGQDPVASCRDSWQHFFSGLPVLTCSDPYLERYYWYRWYGLGLLSQPERGASLPHPAVAEGPGQFRLPISYSVQCHVRELRWRHDATLAKASLLNFLENQRDSGEYPGHLRRTGGEPDTFYHADWGGSLLNLLAVHPDQSLLALAYESLSRYARYLDEARDTEETGLTDVVNHFETGQEYSSRYLAVDPEADAVGWGARFRLKGVDATVYSYLLKRALAWMGSELRRPEAGTWKKGAAAVGRSIVSRMWDAGRGMFSDVDPRTGQRTGVKAAVCFYPYMTDLVGPRHLLGLRRHLFNPDEFWTRYPVATLSVDDPLFDPDGFWRGIRRNCPWNGRVWPMTNSHLVEALAVCGVRLDPGLAGPCGELLTRFVKMMFCGGDHRRPNCFEHYHPYTGAPSTYRGIDDYQHSWVVDLLMKCVAGVRPQVDGSIVIAPVPLDLAHLEVRGLVVRGRELRVVSERGAPVAVMADGRQVCSVERGCVGRIQLD
jgi:hypothetical protein